MITDDDVNKLKKAFKETSVTKDDLKALAKHDDFKRVEQKVGQVEQRLGSIEQKVASVDQKVDEVKSTLDNLTDAVGAIFLWTDDVHRAIVGKPIKILHEN